MRQKILETAVIKPVKPLGLVISKSSKQTLTKNQQAFNKLTQKIEKLHQDIENKHVQFDKALEMYGKEIHPVQQKLAQHQRRLITILWEVYKSNQLAKADQRHLRNILKGEVKDVCAHLEGEPDEALKKIYGELEGLSYEKIQAREKVMLKEEMEDMFDEYDLDMDGVDMMDEKALYEKINELKQQMSDEMAQQEAQFQQRKKKKKLSPKQAETERQRLLVEEIQQKNISTIYKQLAKLFHPDLEQDEHRRAEKEILMKELTAAYEAKNLHTLLMLELKWIHKENDHLESLGDEKLTIYLQILREQARNLEQEINSIGQQPRYQVLVQQFGFGVERTPFEKVKKELKHLTNVELSFKEDLENFESPHRIRYIKTMITAWKAMQQQYKHKSEEELINELLGKVF